MNNIFHMIIKDKGYLKYWIACLLLIVCVQTAYWYYDYHKLKACIISAFVAMTLIAGYLVFQFKKSEANQTTVLAKYVFPIALLSLGLMSCVFFPAGTVPDEPYHFSKSYSYWETLSGADFSQIRAEDKALFSDGGMLSTHIDEGDWQYVTGHIFNSADSDMIDVDNLGKLIATAPSEVNVLAELPQQKLPSALGIGLGLSLGLNHVWVFYLGRLFNFLFAFFLIVAAVRIIPVGKAAMMIVSLFPMTLQLLGSYSYDAPTIGFAFLLTAFVVKAFCQDEKVSNKHLAYILITAFLLAPCKVVYALIAFTLLFLPSSHFSSKKQHVYFKTALVLIPLLAIVFLKLSSLSNLAASNSEGDMRGTETGTFWSVGDILANPVGSIAMLLRSFESLGVFWLLNIPGDSLGWFQGDISLPDYTPMAFLLLFLISSAKSKDDKDVAPLALRFSGLVACFISSFGIIMSMWLGWTFVTEGIVLGVQGRYFVPLLPLLAIVLRGNSIEISRNTCAACLLSVVVLSGLSFSYIASVCS